MRLAFADPSFLFACFLNQDRSERATAFLAEIVDPILTSCFVRFEFENGVRFEAFLRRTQGHRGVPGERVPQILGAWEAALEGGAFFEQPCDWAAVADVASELSNRHTVARGTRAFDVLHVATALHLGAAEFLTFDAGQRGLAEAEGLIVPL